MIFSKNLKRLFAGIIIVSHTGVISFPAMATIQETFGRAKPGTEGSVDPKDLQRHMQESVSKMQIRLAELQLNARMDLRQQQKLMQQQNAVKAETAQQILKLQANITQETAKVVQELRQEIVQFKQKKIDSKIITRQEQTANLIEQRQSTMNGLFNQLAVAKDSKNRDLALTKISDQMKQWEPKKLQRDFKQLPWGNQNTKVPAPITEKDFKTLVPTLEQYHVKNDKITINTKYQSSINESPSSLMQLWQQAIPLLFTSNNSGTWQKVAFNGMTLQDQSKWPILASLPSTTQAEDLQENEDVQITDSIKELAADLENNPAKIYKWVYDNIEYVPTYGSIQGSAYTLETKRGNATDTSSLLIALLRASKIPARYVSGTINVPADVAKDWVGGVNNLSAAANLIGQGGIPSVIVTNGSKENMLRMEHVWVEAKINYTTSKASIENNSQIMSWIPLDASYKRYQRTQGVNIAKAVPVDAKDILKKVEQGSIVDKEGYSVQNTSNNIEAATANYKNKVQAYLDRSHPGASMKDIIGTQSIKPYASQTISAILPYEVVAVVRDYHTLPDSMRYYFQINTYDANDVYASALDNYSVQFKIPSTRLQGKSLALSFKPSTASDLNALNNLMPKGSSTQANNLPKSVPSSIQMTGEITLDGQVLKTLPSYSIGTEIQANIGFTAPIKSSMTNKKFTVGEYHAIGYNMQGISQYQLYKLQDQLSKTQKSINNNQLNLLTKHDYTGALLQFVVNGYFKLNDAQTNLLAKTNNMVSNPYMSFGSFSTSIQAVYSWGVLRLAKPSGMVMDIDHNAATQVDLNNNHANLIAFTQQQGIAQSLNENLVPELLLKKSKTATSIQGVSAVKALQLANAQGQKIYQINQSNIDQVIPLLNHDVQVISDIKNAVYAGKVVLTSATKIALNGWIGSGYIIFDLNTGAGAYMISGGLNGGFTSLTDGHGTTFSLAGMFPSLAFLEKDALSASFAEIKNVYEVYINEAQAFLECNKEVVLNSIVALGIGLAILAAAAATIGSLGTGAPVVVPLMATLTLMFSANASANKGATESCTDKCPNGEPRNQHGQCWICPDRDRDIVHNFTELMKKQASAITNCGKSPKEGKPKSGSFKNLTKAEFEKRAAAWQALVDARIDEYKCWDSEHKGHIDQLDQNKKSVAHCLNGAAQAIN